jgi:hypothetical protein
MDFSRRKFLTGLTALVAAPAVIRVADLMPVKRVPFIPYVRFYQNSLAGEKIAEDYFYIDLSKRLVNEKILERMKTEARKMEMFGKVFFDMCLKENLDLPSCFFEVVKDNHDYESEKVVMAPLYYDPEAVVSSISGTARTV